MFEIIFFRFLHYSLDEEEHYRKFGEFPQTDETPTNPIPPPDVRYNRDFRYNNNGPSREMEPTQGHPPQAPPTSNGYRGSYGGKNYLK